MERYVRISVDAALDLLKQGKVNELYVKLDDDIINARKVTVEVKKFHKQKWFKREVGLSES